MFRLLYRFLVRWLNASLERRSGFRQRRLCVVYQEEVYQVMSYRLIGELFAGYNEREWEDLYRFISIIEGVSIDDVRSRSSKFVLLE